jgi:hypothetical protein
MEVLQQQPEPMNCLLGLLSFKKVFGSFPTVALYWGREYQALSIKPLLTYFSYGFFIVHVPAQWHSC